MEDGIRGGGRARRSPGREKVVGLSLNNGIHTGLYMVNCVKPQLALADHAINVYVCSCMDLAVYAVRPCSLERSILTRLIVNV
jgi:hypothetical protein